MDQASQTVTQDDQPALLADGRAVMSICGTWWGPQIVQTFPDYDWTFELMPVLNEDAGALFPLAVGKSYAVNANSDHPEICTEILNFLYTDMDTFYTAVNNGAIQPFPIEAFDFEKLEGMDEKVLHMNPFYGLNTIFEKMGLEKQSKVLWLGEPKISLFSVAFVDNWHWWGFVMALFLGALQQVDPTLYEAARVDGANSLQELVRVSIPGIRQTIAFVLIMTIMWSFLTFDYVYVMTNGGPANSTEILETWIYKNAFVKYSAGYANALCVLQSGICILLYFFQKWVSKRGGLDDE